MLHGIGLINDDVLRFYNERPPRRHGVTRIDGQVHKDLFNLPCVRSNVTSIAPEIRFQHHVFADQSAKHFFYSGDHLI